ncbi:MAG: hypothetical protein K1X47_07760 [Cyclobacteriaceae bacterium]|nr:hypothetical protein [Cyclobacteriaceae bacterium]
MKTVVCLLLLLMPLSVLAQDEEEAATFPLEKFYAKRKPWTSRKLLSQFKFSLSTGAGNTFFSHRLTGFGIYQPAKGSPLIFNSTAPLAAGLTNWVNHTESKPFNLPLSGFLVSGDTTRIGFKGNALNIPLKATIHFEWDRYRIGGGYSYEIMMLGSMHPITYKDKIGNFTPADGFGFMQKYFGSVGVSFYRVDKYLFTGDAQVGGFKPGNNFSMGQIQKGVYVNAGVTVERELSEYLRVFARPSFEIKNYTLSVPGGPPIYHYINAFYFNIGLTYSIPELPRCYNKDCRAQMNHVHGEREYRSGVHPLWKKQNPGYGENDPTLLKYKGKNKRKLNPN